MSQKPISSIGIEDAFQWHLATQHSVSVREFGAMGDGKADDSAAIREAMAFACASGKTLLFPVGTYNVTPAGAYVFSLCGAVRIKGDGKALTTIKVSDNAGHFYAVFHDASHDLTGLTVCDLTIDMNVDNNPITDLAEIMAHPRMAFYLGSGATGSKIRFENIEVKNNSSVNTISTTDALSDVTVRGCTFRNKKDPNSIAHDHSTLYLMSTYNSVCDNYFEGDACPSVVSACAIETHGSHTVIANNLIRKFSVAMNLTGVSSIEDTTDITVTGNVGDDLDTGFALLWSYEYLTHTTGYGLDGVVIANNTAHIKQTAAAAGSTSIGIGIYPTNTLPVRNVSIHHNTLIWEKELADRDMNNASFGIGYWSVNDCAVENMTIDHNLIENMPVSGIRLSCPIVNVSVCNNLLRNCGSTLHAAIAGAYRAPIFVSPYTVSGLLIRGNLISDDFSVTRIPYAVYFLAQTSGTPSGVQLIDNPINVTGADQSAFTTPYYLDAGCAIYARGIIPDGHTPTLYGQVAGSEWLDASLNKRYVIVPGAMIEESRAAAAPTTGDWLAGSVVYNAAPASGQPMGWMCTVAGTPGTWKAMGNLA